MTMEDIELEFEEQYKKDTLKARVLLDQILKQMHDAGISDEVVYLVMASGYTISSLILKVSPVCFEKTNNEISKEYALKYEEMMSRLNS